jgi:hypothetical protein
MGASGWQYTTPYDADLQAALDRLRAETFHRGEYFWLWEGEWVDPGEERPRPATMAELLADEAVATEGTHSIIDCPRIVHGVPATDLDWSSSAYFGAVVPVTRDELVAAVGTDRPTAQHLDTMDERVACARWVGRCTVLYSDSGTAEQLAFWGYSGD